jgi:hypothetical protein
MSLRERIEAAARRAGFDSQADLAAACGVKQPSIHALISGKYPMKDLLRTVAAKTGVSPDWLRDGNPHDAPPWAREPLMIAVDDAQEAVRRLHAVTAERDQLAAELAKAKDALAKLALRMAAEPEPMRSAASGRTRYRIGQTQQPIEKA